MSGQRVNVENSRDDDQRRVMEAIADDSVCPFCGDNLQRYRSQPILKENDHWVVIKNQWPYEHTKHHFLLITKQHIETVTELPAGGFEALGELVKALAKEHGMSYGALAIRFGDVRFTGASVNHLHAHVLQAAEEMPEGAKLKMKLSR